MFIIDREEQTLTQYKSIKLFLQDLFTYYIKYKKDYKIVLSAKKWTSKL